MDTFVKDFLFLSYSDINITSRQPDPGPSKWLFLVLSTKIFCFCHIKYSDIIFPAALRAAGMVDFGSRQRFFVFDIFGYSDIILPAALRAAGAMWDYNYFWRRSAPHCVPPARDDAPRYVPGHSAHPCRCGPVFLPGGSPGNGGTRLLPLTDFGACVMRCSPTTFRCMCLHTDRLTGCAWPPTTFRFAGPAPCPPALPIRARPTSAMFGVALSARQPHTVCPCRAMPCSLPRPPRTRTLPPRS